MKNGVNSVELLMNKDNTERSLSSNAFERVSTRNRGQLKLVSNIPTSALGLCNKSSRYSQTSLVIMREKIKSFSVRLANCNSAPIGGIFYYELKYDTDKGSISSGQNLIESFSEHYSDELIDQEIIGTGNASATNFSSTLDFTPIKTSIAECTDPTLLGSGLQDGGAVQVFAGSVSGVDDGEGNITGDGVTGTVDYSTGAISVDLAVAPASGVEVYAKYIYDTECNSTIPEVSLDIQLCEIRAKTRKLKALWCSKNTLDTLAA